MPHASCAHASRRRRWDTILARILASSDSSPCRLVVVGGGAGGVELALSMQARLQRELAARGKSDAHLSVTLASRSDAIMPQHSAGVRRIFSRLLADRGVHTRLGCDVRYVTPSALHCADGTELRYEEAIFCTQAGAQEWLRTTGLELDDDGFIAVRDTLQSTTAANVFACGDVAAVLAHPRPKAGVFAVRQGPPLTSNLRAALRGEPPAPFVPQTSFLGLIGAGDGRCVASRGAMALEARWLWTLKDWIDTNWMRVYTDGLPEMGGAAGAAPSAVAADVGQSALDALSHASMRCGGCGAKVGASVLSRVLQRLRDGGHLPAAPESVLVGLDAPDDCAVLAPSSLASVHTVDFFRSFIDDPYVFGQIAANHALSDVHAMGARCAGALAVAVVPYGLESKVEESLFHMMAGAAAVLAEAGCPLIGGHSCEGAELSLGFAVVGASAVDAAMRKGGMREGDVLVLTKPIGTGALFAAHMRGVAAGSWVAAATRSMVVSNRRAAAALAAHGATACTDVTGFGLLGHLVEMASASSARVALSMGSVPLLAGAAECVARGVFSSLQPSNLRLKRAVSNEAEALAHPAYPLLFDPQTSGGLLASVPAGRADACIRALRDAGFERAAVVGRVTQKLPDGTCAPTLVECGP